MTTETDIIVLAAGKGTRMKSALPKVLHKLAGRPLLRHVLDAGAKISNSRAIVVTGHGADQLEQQFVDSNLQFVRQDQQLGTAHAVGCALPLVDNNAKVLILYGDVPLIQADTLNSLIQNCDENSVALLTVELQSPAGYGRIVRDVNGAVIKIVEQKDASPEQLAITEVNTGVMALTAQRLQQWIPQIGNDNAQGEYYLTDIIALATADGCRINVTQPGSAVEVEGVNDRRQLAQLERAYQLQQADRLMIAGVALADPARLDVRGTLTTGSDVFIDVNAVFEGHVSLGNGVSIGPNCHIIDSVIGAGVEIKSHTVLEQVLIGDNAVVGPFARLRPGTELAANAKIGNFVETKKTKLGIGSKINHLSYVGDAVLGEKVNVGAGTITCNYDGVNKWQTEIGDGAFIGSNSSLVAPVKIGAGATVGAGSTITKSVNDGTLALTRAKQQQIDGWHKPIKKTDK